MNLETALTTLGLESLSGLSLNALKVKYRTLAKQRHPDSGSGSSADFVKLREAFLYLQERLNNNYSDSASNDLKTLSKDEILDRYYKDTKDLQNKLEIFNESLQEQSEIIDHIRGRVQAVVDEFEEKKKVLQKELETEISKLEKKYTNNFIQKILPWLKMSEREFWDLYDSQVQEYAKKHTEMDLEFLREMLSAYGDGLNEISKTVDKV